MRESDREVLHIIDVTAIQNRISTYSREKALHATAEDKVLQGQVAIKNGAVAEANSAVVDLAAFNPKAGASQGTGRATPLTPTGARGSGC